MIGRFVEISKAHLHLSLYRGFLEVSSKEDGKIGREPLDDLLGVIVSSHGCTHSSNLIAALAERNISFVICGSNLSPVAWMLPLTGSQGQSGRMRAQLSAGQPVRKRVWQQLIRAKVSHQASVLEHWSASGSKRLAALSSKVRSGDPDNIEAQASRLYWPRLFGEGFRRESGLSGINTLLNYGYAIIRSCVARGVCAAGLHPTLGVHHIGPTNPLCLVDDLMEPMRPIADYAVRSLVERGILEVSPAAKEYLASLAVIDLYGTQGVTPLFQGAVRMAASLAMIYAKEERSLAIPPFPLPLSFASLNLP